MSQHIAETSINQWGNGLALRLNQRIARAAGLSEGSLVRLIAEPGRIVVEAAEQRPSLEDMLDAFDPDRHGQEAMPFHPLGSEVA